MNKDFDLAVILTVTTGINLTDNFDDVYEMSYFIYNSNLIGSVNLQGMRSHMKKHILSIHPELKDIRLNFSTNEIDNWISIQKAKFGNTLPICRYGESLDKNDILIKSKKPTNKS